MNRKSSGFTLIELLVTISIIGVLGTVVLTNISTAKQKAKDAALITEATQLFRIVQAGLAEMNTNDYSPMYVGTNWLTNVGDANCDTPPTGFPSDLGADLTAACHRLYATGGIGTIGANAAKPILMGIKQPKNSPPWSVNYTADWGISIKTTNGNLICVGGNGSSNGTYDLARANSSCYNWPPAIP